MPLSRYKSPTASGILEILKYYKISIRNKKVVIVGKGMLVGMPFAELAKTLGAKVAICDKGTKDLSKAAKKADILVSGAGKEKLIDKNMVSGKSIVVDAGTQVIKGSQVGDVDFKNVARKVKAIVPPKEGLGPVTIACLIRNLIHAAKSRGRT